MKQDIFKDTAAIITGASSGIGRALALQLSAQGAKVALAARRADLLELAAAECRGLGGEAIAIPTDVSDEDQCKALVEKSVAAFGKLDLLVNNAGLTVISLFKDLPDLHLFRHAVEINFFGAVNCTYHALPYLIQNRGRIVAVSSVGGRAAIPYNTSYIASKFALNGFFDSLRMELVRHGVSVTVIYPSWVVSGFHEAQLDRKGRPMGARGRAIYSKKTMTSEQCGEIILKAAEKRRREVVMSPGHLVGWLNVLSPQLMDWFSVNVYLKSAMDRAHKKGGQASDQKV
jgi:short-subunit dehydrogenase